MRKKIYLTFTFFKVCILGIALSMLILLILSFLFADSLYFIFGLLIFILGVGLIIYRILQLIYAMQLERRSDTNQIESTLWIYSKFTPTLPLPPMRDIAASPDFLKEILHQVIIGTPQVIVEVGSGVSSIILSEYLRQNDSSINHIALDHLELYADQTRKKILNSKSRIVFAPLKEYTLNGKIWQWYDIECLSEIEQIDLLIIDGPPEYIQKLARYPALPLLREKISNKTVIVLDDTNRRDELKIIGLWRNELNLNYIYIPTEKGTHILFA